MNPIVSLALRHLLLAGVGAGLIILLAISLRLLVRRDAVLRYRVMVSALIAATAMLPLQIFIAERSPRVPVAEFSTTTLPKPSLVPTPQRSSDSTLPPPPALLANAPAPTPLPPTPKARSLDATLIALAVYLLGATLVLGWHIRGVGAARRLLAGAAAVRDPRVLRIWQSLVAGSRRPPLLLECPALHAPACRTLGRAAVIVPAPSDSLDDDTLASSLRHELVHLSRFDGLVAALAIATSVLLWFQPLAWIFVRLLGIDREHSCDAIVVRATGRPQAYARALLRFCDPHTTPRRPAPLIGFESAHSVRRRITMLSHALHPASRFRRVALLLAGGVAIASAFTAHGWFTAAAAPGSLLPNRPVPRPTMLSADLDTTPQLSVEVLAPTDGRSDAAIYKRVLEIQRAKDLLQEPGGLIRTQAPADGSWAFFIPERPKIYPEGTWVTDQESILSAANARWEGDTLHADRARLRLPGGSKLRAVFEGRMVRAEPGLDQIDRVLVTEGEIRILDEQGATRIQIRADGNGILVGTAVPTPGEIAFDISAADDHAGLLATMDTRADAPEDEQQPPHGAPRWKLHTPPPGGGATELRLQWNYNLGELQFLNLEGC